jgi:hypothetical protein
MKKTIGARGVVRARSRRRTIFRAWITTPSGKRIYARTYGIRAFPVKVKR